MLRQIIANFFNSIRFKSCKTHTTILQIINYKLRKHVTHTYVIGKCLPFTVNKKTDFKFDYIYSIYVNML